VAANPVAFLIPCHRVLRKTGQFGKYHWGEDRKKILVAYEASICSTKVGKSQASNPIAGEKSFSCKKQ